MMKKTLCAFLMILVSGIANANIHIDGKKAREIVLKHIDQEHQVPALQEYNVQLKATGNYTMSAAGLYKVCTAAGWDIAKPEGKIKCENFVKALVAESDYKYYAACDKKYKDNKNYKCIDNVFYHWYTVADTQVTMLQADGLCKEYAKVKFKDDIECNSTPRTVDKNEYVQCTSKLNPTYYEFKFDDVVEGADSTILRGVLKAVGEMHNVDLSDPGCTIERIMNDTACSIGYKTTDANVCAKINTSLKTFGYTAEVRNLSRAGLNSEKLCGISGITMTKANLKTAYGIPNDVFYDGRNQRQGAKDLKDLIKQYVANTIKPEQITSFDCISNTIKIPSIKGNKDNDDVLTCYVNGNQIDFVFDDLSETMKLLYNNSSNEFMNCTIEGGTYSGRRCLHVGEEACKKIAQSTFLVQECPECSKLYWDGNICTLPASTIANALEKGVNLAIIAGGAVLNVYITYQTGGLSTLTGQGLLFVESVGSLIEAITEIKMDVAADNFFVESSKCHDKTCAKTLIDKHLQRLSNFYSRLTDTEEKAIDKEMARLFKLIPAEELFTVEALVKVDQENGGKKLASVKENQKGFFDPKSWEKEQIWQAVGITMQMASLFYQIGSWIYGKTHKTVAVMDEVIDVLDDKADEAMKSFREKGLNVEIDENGVVHFLDTPIDDMMSSYVDDIALKYNKHVEFRSGLTNSLGHNYYRIIVNDNDDVAGIIADLHKNGYFVSSNQTNNGEKFIAVSKENIFQQWDNAPTNWLKIKTTNISSYVTDIALKYNKHVEFRSGLTNSLGHDYYRIIVNDNDDVAGIIADLQRNGYFVSSNQTNNGEKFIAASKENIFQSWDNLASNWLKNGAKSISTTNISSYVDDIARKYNKQVEFRSGPSNSLGHDYYRIIVNDNDDVAGIIDYLQKNGCFISSNQMNNGTKFIAVSDEYIFQPWDAAPTNWLKGYNGGSIRGLGIFDKVYNDMPEDVLRRKLDYIYSIEKSGGSDHDIIEAMKAVGAFDERQAGLLAEDIANETIRRISENPDLVQAGKNWRNLSEYEKRQFVLEVHDIVTQERRTRMGNTMILFDTEYAGSHRAPYGANPRQFTYNTNTTIEDMLDTIIHENTHSFQSVYRSSIPEPLVRLSENHYVSPKQNRSDYKNILIEMESWYVAEHSAPKVARALGWL